MSKAVWFGLDAIFKLILQRSAELSTGNKGRLSMPQDCVSGAGLSQSHTRTSVPPAAASLPLVYSATA
jgi:hypothetical protein